MSQPTAETPAQQLAAFRRLALQELAKLGRAADLTSSAMSDYAARAGLPSRFAPDTSGAGYEIPDVPDEQYGPQGLERSLFTEQALAAHDAEALQRQRRGVYAVLNQIADRSRARLPMVREALAALGLPLPAMVTHVDAQVAGIGTVVFTLDGEVGYDEIRAKLTEVASDPRRDAILAAFPQAAGVGELVTSLWVQAEERWTPAREI